MHAISMLTNTSNTQNHHPDYQKVSFTFHYFHASEGLNTKPVIAEFFHSWKYLYMSTVFMY